MLPGVGYALAVLVVGGLVFGIGNVGGTGLGVDAKFVGAISALLAVAILLSKRAGVALDRIVVVLGAVVILMTAYVAVVSGPSVGDALRQTVLPDQVDFLVITTLIGGTVGGYITYAGAHRWAASTSVIGAAYTSVSFLTSSSTSARRRILPIGFTVVLWVAWRRRDLLGGYRYPAGL